MADLLTHLAVARVPAAFVKDRHVSLLLILGTFLPDLAAKSLYWIAWASEDFVRPTHSLPGLLCLSYLASLWVALPLRRAAFAAFFTGGLLHVAVDMLKDTLDQGAVFFLYPFSTRGFEFGLVDPENVIFFLPLNAVLLTAAWLIERRRHVRL
ncbi:MAG TPA: metal-dependent hydrolase [Planctomycetota bacterium]|nr:metal-dependent hydrolase [Planctomycetota bacterium]